MKKMVLVCATALVMGACDPGGVTDDDVVQDTIDSRVDDSVVDGNGDNGQIGVDTASAVDGSDDGGIDIGDGMGESDPALTDTDSSVADVGDGALDGGDTADAADTTSVAGDTGEVVGADTAVDVVLDTNDEEADTSEFGEDSDVVQEDTENGSVDTDAEGEDTDATVCVPTLVINEVDYDVPGKYTAEFVELFNPTACDMPLAGISLVLVNGGDMEEYRRISLSDAAVEILAAGEYLVIHGSELAFSQTGPTIVMTLANGFIQNGPDGLALFDETNQTLLDSFCYETEMTAVVIDGVEGTLSLVEGAINPELVDTGDEGVSLSRLPNGTDVDNAATDWSMGMATPGAANVSAAAQ